MKRILAKIAAQIRKGSPMPSENDYEANEGACVVTVVMPEEIIIDGGSCKSVRRSADESLTPDTRQAMTNSTALAGGFTQRRDEMLE